MIFGSFARDTAAPPAFPAARGLLLSTLETLPSERVELHAAHGRVLAGALHATADLVPYSRSAMDGFAVRACDVAPAPVTLAVVSSIYAKFGDDALTPGTAAAIATGAPLPHGSDAVIPVECVAVRGATISIAEPIEAGANIFPPAQDAARGDVLVAQGELAGPGNLGLLAAAGYDTVAVTRRPRVAIVCTGDELVATHANPLRGQVRNSNGIMLAALVADSGGSVAAQRTLPDDIDALTSAFARLLCDVDMLVVTGGASRGPRDFVKAALDRLDARWLFTSVAIRPGRPAGTALVNGKPVFALPGNPAAAFVAATLFVEPALRRLSGRRAISEPLLHARLSGNTRAKRDRHSFIFGRFDYRETLCVEPLANQCSSLIRTAAAADALIVLEPGERRYVAGDTAPVLPLRTNVRG